MRIDCSQIDKLKEAYVDGLLTPEVRAALESHAAGCSTCRRRLALAHDVQAQMGRAVKAALGRTSLSLANARALEEKLNRRLGRTSAIGMRRPFFALPGV